MDSTQFFTDLLMSNVPDRAYHCLTHLEQLEQLNQTLISYLIPMQKCHFSWDIQCRSLPLLERHASPQLFAHIQTWRKTYGCNRNWIYYQCNDLFFHPEIDYIDAVFAEKRLNPYPDKWTATAIPTLFLYDTIQNHHYTRLERLPFIDAVIVSSLQSFDFQYFMEMIKPLRIKYLQISHIEHFVSPINLKAIWQMPHLEYLILDSKDETAILTIPNEPLKAPIHYFSALGFKIAGVAYLNCFVSKLKNFYINHDNVHGRFTEPLDFRAIGR